MTIQKDEQYLSSVKNALRILRSFTVDDPEKKIVDLSESLGLNKSTVSRTMSTLASEGFVFKDPESKKYRLGFSILSLSGIVNTQTDVIKEAQPILNKLVNEINETVHISVIDDSHVIYLQKVECNHPVQFLTHVGRRNPLHCTSSGKLLLAYSGEEFINNVVEKGLPKYTRNTITDPEQLRRKLKEIREKGISYSIEEYTDGVNSVAAPIYNYQGKVIAALTTVGPMQRIQPHKILSFSKKIKGGAREISSRMGYRECRN